MSWLERTIGAVAALRAARQRQALKHPTRACEGSGPAGGATAGTSANAEIGPALSRLGERSRNLLRNNP